MTNANKTATTIVSALLPDDLYTFIENFRWDNRLTKSRVIVDALTDWAKSKGYEPRIEDTDGSPDKVGGN